jgi:hypothetical protein
MACKKCPNFHEAPDSYWWATHKRYRWRGVVLVALNGGGHRRVFHARFSSGSYGIEDFEDWDGPLLDPHPPARAKEFKP